MPLDRRQFLQTTIAAGVASAGAAAQTGAPGVAALRTEYMENPIGIDIPDPRLSWEVGSARAGEKQTAYQVLVSSSQSGAGDLWDSGRVNSDRMAQIVYA